MPPPAPAGCAPAETGGPPAWTPRALMSLVREGSTAVIIGDRLHVTHGSTPYDALTTSHQILDISDNGWSGGPEPSVARADVAGVCIEDAGGQGLLFVVGGIAASGPVGDVEIYDPVAEAWTLGASMPTARRAPAAAFVPAVGVAGGSLGSVFVLGGDDGTAPGTGTPLAVNEAYDVETGVWATRAPPPVAVTDAAAVFEPKTGKVLLIGGHDGTAARAAVQIYDPLADAWTPGSPMPTPRSRLTAGVCGGKVYALGGWDGTAWLPVNESYLSCEDFWSPAGPAMPAGYAGMGAQAAYTGSEIFSFGSVTYPTGGRDPIGEAFTCGAHPGCVSAADCDDGYFCDGAERCPAGTGVCLPGSPPRCGDGDACTADACQAPVVIFEDDFETGGGYGWSHASRGGADTWHYGLETCFAAQPPSRMFISYGNMGTTCVGNSSNEHSHLLSPPITLPAAATLRLEFDAFSHDDAGPCTWLAYPDSHDAGITTDGGATYTTLNYCYPLTDGTGAFLHHAFDITAFAGQTVQVIFVYDTLTSTAGADFGIDNVRITAGDACRNEMLPDGASCADALFCNGEELCSGGVCLAGTAVQCDDADPCTADFCDDGVASCVTTGPSDSETAAGADAACGTADDNPALFGPDSLCGTADDGVGDGMCDLLDICPLAHDPGQEDGDGDGVGDACDCSMADGQLWALPGEVAELAFTDSETLTWTPPAEPGCVAVAYDTLRSQDAFDFTFGAVCVETNDGADTTAVDTTAPAPGEVLYYLTRARDGCGCGCLGYRSDAGERIGRSCP